MQKPEIPNIPRHLELQMVVLSSISWGPESGQSTATKPPFGKGNLPQNSQKFPGRMCQFLRPQNSISVQKQKIHDCHVFGEIIGIWFWNGCHSTCHVHHPEKKACGQLRSPEGAAVLLESWIESGFWNSKQLVLNLPLVIGGDRMFTRLPWKFRKHSPIGMFHHACNAFQMICGLRLLPRLVTPEQCWVLEDLFFAGPS